MTTENYDIVITERGGAGVKATIEGIAAASDKSDAALSKVERRMSLMDSGAARLKASFSGIPGILSTAGTAIGAAFSIGKIVEYADSFTNIQNQLRRTTKDSTALAAATDEVFKISQATRSDFEGNVGTYTRLQQSLQAMGKEAKLAGPLLTTINQAMAVSGTSSEAAKTGMIQFQQALQGGVLRGEEFNSIVESTPGLLAALAVGLGKPVGALRQMAEQGELTSKTVIEALQKAAPAVAASFANVVPTVSSALVTLNNAFVRYLGEEKQGMVRLLAQGIMGLANNLQAVIPWVTALGGAIGVILGLQFLVWIGGVTVGLATMALGAAAAALAFAPMVLTFGALAAAAIFLVSKFVDLGAAYDAIKAKVTGYVAEVGKVASGSKEASTGSKTLDDVLKSLNSQFGAAATGAGKAGSAASGMAREYSLAAQAGSALEAQIRAVDAANNKAAQAADVARQKQAQLNDEWARGANEVSRLSAGVIATTNDYQAFATAADRASQAAGQQAAAMAEAAESAAILSRNLAEATRQNAAAAEAAAKYAAGRGGSNIPMAKYNDDGSVAYYYNEGAGMAYLTPEGRAAMERLVKQMNAALPNKGQTGATFSGNAGGAVFRGTEAASAMSNLTNAMNDNTSAITDLNQQLSPQGYDPTTMGRVFVPTSDGFTRETQGSGGGSSGTPFKPGVMGPAGPSRVVQNITINTPNSDSFRRSRRQIAADARRALGG